MSSTKYSTRLYSTRPRFNNRDLAFTSAPHRCDLLYEISYVWRERTTRLKLLVEIHTAARRVTVFIDSSIKRGMDRLSGE